MDVQIAEKLAHLKAREKEYLLHRLESAVYSSMQSVEFWEKSEKEARTWHPSWHAYIANIKHRRKRAQSDTEYCLEKLAHFVKEHKIPYVLMNA